MVKFLGLEISVFRLVLRVVYATVVAGIDLFVFYYLPANLGSLISKYAPANYASSINSALSGFVTSTLPMIGIVLAVLTFCGILFKGTRIYGAFLILNGVFYIVYTYIFFQGGTLHIGIPSGLVQGVTGSFALQLTLLMVLLMIPSALTIVKGGVLLAQANRAKPKQPEKVAVTAPK